MGIGQRPTAAPLDQQDRWPSGGIKNSKQDVLFNNDVCVVVPPGIVAEILKRVTHVAAYAREDSLYVGDVILSSFARQGPKA